MTVSDSVQNIRQSKKHRSVLQDVLRWLSHFAMAVMLASSVYAHAQENQSPKNGEKTEENTEGKTKDTTAEKPKSKKKAIDTQLLHSQRLSKEVDEEDLVWLKANNNKFIGLWKPDTSSASFGAVIILHAPGDTPNTPHTVKALRKNLSFHGWSTLAIAMPDIESLDIPKRVKRTPLPVKDEKKDGETDPSTPAMSQEEIDAAIENTPEEIPPKNTNKGRSNPDDLSEQRINAAMQFLHDKGQYNIALVAFGANAVRAAKFVSGLKPTKANTASRKSKFNMRSVRAFIMIDANNHLRQDKKAEEFLPITSYFKDPSLPIMDIYYGNAWGMEEVKLRKSEARSKKYETYLQVKLMPPSTSDETTFENPLTRRVRGFLDSHARGVEVDR